MTTKKQVQPLSIELELQNEELRRTQVALESSRAHYIELYDFAPVGYLTLSSEGLITEINLAGAKLLGMERKKLIHRRFDRFVADDHKDHWHRHCLHLKQTASKQSIDLPCLRGDGKLFHAHLDCLYQEAKDTSPVMRVTLTDITELIQVNEALEESEDRLKFALIGSGDGMWDWNVVTGEVNYSKQWKAMLGYADDEIRADFKEWEKRVHPEDRQPALATIQSYLSGATPHYSNEHRLLCKDGSYKWILTRGIARTRSPDGTPARMIGTHIDITGHKHTEELLRIAAAAFETPDGIIVTDANKVILRVNQAFSRITGYSAEETINRTPAFLRSGQHQGEFYQSVWDTIECKGHWRGEMWQKRKNGELFPSWHVITAVFGTNGAISHYVGSFTDITAQKLAEKVLLDARQRLENTVATSLEDMVTIKTESTAVNTALNVLLRRRNTDKDSAQISLSNEVEAIVLPLLKKLKGVSKGRLQTTRLLGILETNLQELVKSYGRSAHLDAAYQKLTPLETQVAALVKQGQPTKVIAATLNIAAGTVNIHRKHIRKKLGLDGTTNLHSYLQSLVE
jgi:PAS domain S-box-containing protein